MFIDFALARSWQFEWMIFLAQIQKKSLQLYVDERNTRNESERMSERERNKNDVICLTARVRWMWFYFILIFLHKQHMLTATTHNNSKKYTSEFQSTKLLFLFSFFHFLIHKSGTFFALFLRLKQNNNEANEGEWVRWKLFDDVIGLRQVSSMNHEEIFFSYAHEISQHVITFTMTSSWFR
jgi:hypothetical protein